MLLGAPGIATSNKKLLGAPGLTTRSKKLLGAKARTFDASWFRSIAHVELHRPFKVLHRADWPYSWNSIGRGRSGS